MRFRSLQRSLDRPALPMAAGHRRYRCGVWAASHEGGVCVLPPPGPPAPLRVFASEIDHCSFRHSGRFTPVNRRPPQFRSRRRTGSFIVVYLYNAMYQTRRACWVVLAEMRTISATLLGFSPFAVLLSSPVEGHAPLPPHLPFSMHRLALCLFFREESADRCRLKMLIGQPRATCRGFWVFRPDEPYRLTGGRCCLGLCLFQVLRSQTIRRAVDSRTRVLNHRVLVCASAPIRS